MKAVPEKRPVLNVLPDAAALQRFWWFIAERHTAYYKRHVLRLPPPWAMDEVVASHFFTNVYRELDPGTKFIRATLPFARDLREAVFWALAYRLAFNEHSFRAMLEADLLRLRHFTDSSPRVRALLRKHDHPWTPAYVVSNYGRKGSKVDVITDILMGVADTVRKEFPDGVDLAGRQHFVEWCLTNAHGIGKFVSFQALVDLCYPGTQDGDATPWLPWSNDGWVIAGPGAEAGLRILFPDEQVNQRTSNGLVALLCSLQVAAPTLLNMPGWAEGEHRVPISRSNMQNCCCEFSKYERAREGGRSKRRFNANSSRERDKEALGHGKQLEIV